MWWGTPQHVHNRRAEAAKATMMAEKVAAAVPSLGTEPMDLDVKGDMTEAAATDTLSSGLQALLREQDCCDLLFSACGEELLAHAVVLAAGSNNFRDFLRNKPVPGTEHVDKMEGLFSWPSSSEEVPSEQSCKANDAVDAKSSPPDVKQSAGTKLETGATEVAPATHRSADAPSPGLAEAATQRVLEDSGANAGRGVQAATTTEPEQSPKGSPLRLQVNGLSSSQAFRILLDYLYVSCTGAKWEYTPLDSQVNKDVLRLARHFGLSQLHEHAARWLAKGLTTANVVERLVTCEEFGLGLLREKITERLTLNPPELMAVCSSPEITQHPRILQDLLVQVASIRHKAPPPQERPSQVEKPPAKRPRKAGGA
eukprot:TRINITY_DN19388_c0_g1_i1.p1 TRINITY_DN19388_c0_g1~~TRINITY_DN19388_c0_g1_i1.p1  ORF type:complete len:369 (-),score=78.38 TRINITY_DN19388_c0_g1_i1:378-1484(-)